MLRIHNTLSKKKEIFTPIDPTNVRLYHCGPTVYDFAHIGNARPAVVFDVLFRVLQKLYPRVTYVRNITDVDDKIIMASEKTGESITSLTTRTTQAYHEDMAALGVLPPTHEPRATQHIPQMIAMIECLIEKGHAYANEGHVLFNVKSDPAYGVLSKRSLEDMIAGARVEVAPYKKDPMDFILWKPSTPDMPGWESPWGYGRPGWHIECSAMSARYLGDTFDIHVGGQDLIFPHHENERAQSTCANNKPFVNYWMHNGYLVVEGEKMSKSLGNFLTVRDLRDQAPGEVIRYALLSTHYTQPLNWTQEGLKSAARCLDRLYLAMRNADQDKSLQVEIGEGAAMKDSTVFQALLDDLNTPLALSALHDIASRLNKTENIEERRDLLILLRQGSALLGLLTQTPEAWFQQCPESLDPERIACQILARNKAREVKDFKESDRIRDALLKGGIILEDTPQGTLWRRINE